MYNYQYEDLNPHYFTPPQFHMGYVNSIDIDKQTRNLLLCGGSDACVSIWDINDPSDPKYANDTEPLRQVHTKPLVKLAKNEAHSFGISKIQWWPFDNAMFFSASFDGTLKVWDSESLEEVYNFKFDNKVYNFDVNCVSEDGLIAVGLNHPNIRLIDLRVAASTQSLKGHSSGSVCSVKWCPQNDYQLASGGTDGTVRIWDIRQANQEITSMDMMRTNEIQQLTPLSFRRAHRAVVNGLAWHPTKQEVLSVGLDNKARIWDLNIDGGMNKSVNFGPLFQNRRQQTMDPCLTFPGDIEDELYVFLPSDTGDFLMCQYSDGKMVNRYVPPGKENRINRQASVCCRGPNQYEVFSTPYDGSVLKWSPEEDSAVDGDGDDNSS